MEHTLGSAVKVETGTNKGSVYPPHVGLSTTGTSPHLGTASGCLHVRGIQMFMTMLSGCRKIRCPEGRKKLYIYTYIRADE